MSSLRVLTDGTDDMVGSGYALIVTRPNLITDHEKVPMYGSAINRAGRDAALVINRLRDCCSESGAR